jgi:hypothetical protein
MHKNPSALLQSVGSPNDLGQSFDNYLKIHDQDNF